MAKTLERNRAIDLRQNGFSIKDIARSLKLSKSTVSIWCRDIRLTQKQVSSLHDKMVRGSYIGRLKGAQMQHASRLRRADEAEKNGIKEVGNLSKRDLLLVFSALYWGEGSKKNGSFSINNSDPAMIQLIIKSIRKLFAVEKERFILAVGINVIHKKRDEEIKDYWSKITDIPKTQFRKTIFIKAKNKKNYSNFGIHYGTLRVNVTKSKNIYYKMLGLIKGLQISTNKPA